MPDTAFHKPSRPVFLRDFCVAAHGADCDRCVRACPKGAIAFANGTACIDAVECTSCGICAGVCDGFALPGEGIEQLYARLRRTALAGDGVVITCPLFVPEGFAPADTVVEVPCLAALPPELWTACLAEGMSLTVVCDLSCCERCPRAGSMGAALYPRAIEIAEQRTGREVLLGDAVPAAAPRKGLLDTLAETGRMDRREAIDSLRHEAADIASGRYRLQHDEELREVTERRSRQRARLRTGSGADGVPEANLYASGGTVRHVIEPRRRLLLLALDADPALAPRVELALSHTDAERCAGELACAEACPTGARFPHPDTGELCFDARCCIGCGLCVDACPHGAASVEPATAEELLPPSPAPTSQE